jgi:hypothetical protein
VLSTRRETLDGLEEYLRQAGIATACRRAIADFHTIIRGGATAAVIFPDEFTDAAVDALLRELRSSLPDALLLVVTGSPRRYQARPYMRVLPKPSFGWDILDAVRAHAAQVHD